MPLQKPHYRLTLACGHSKYGLLESDDLYYCASCQDFVKGAERSGAYRILIHKLVCKDCKYTRGVYDVWECKELAASHYRKRNHNVSVVVFQTGEVIVEYTRQQELL